MNVMEEYYAQVARKKEAQKLWYAKNRERLNTKSKQYYVDNKAKLKKQSLEIVQCPLCGTPVRRGSLYHHKQTQKCKYARKIHAIYNTKKESI